MQFFQSQHINWTPALHPILDWAQETVTYYNATSLYPSYHCCQITGSMYELCFVLFLPLLFIPLSISFCIIVCQCLSVLYWLSVFVPLSVIVSVHCTFFNITTMSDFQLHVFRISWQKYYQCNVKHSGSSAISPIPEPSTNWFKLVWILGKFAY